MLRKRISLRPITVSIMEAYYDTGDGSLSSHIPFSSVSTSVDGSNITRFVDILLVDFAIIGFSTDACPFIKALWLTLIDTATFRTTE